MRSFPLALVLIVVALPACGGPSGSGGNGTPDSGGGSSDAGPIDSGSPDATTGGSDGGSDSGADTGSDAGVDSGADAATDSGNDAGYMGAIYFPQAVHNAMWVNPAAYTKIPVHIMAATNSSSVTLTLDGGTPVPATLSSDGSWIAQLTVFGLTSGAHTLVASAGGSTATATLGVGTQGMQMTRVANVGNSGTARLLQLAGGTYMTWADFSDGAEAGAGGGSTADGYIQQVDGAGNFLGTKTSIVHAGVSTFDARTAASGDGTKIGVLYQTQTGSSPYNNFIKVVDLSGNDVVPAITLDPAGYYGSYGGDIAWDGSAFVATWRSNNGASESSLYWIRVGLDGTKTGPVTVTPLAMDEGQGEGGFDPITPIHIAAANGVSELGYVQYHDETSVTTYVPKAHATILSSTGTVVSTAYSGSATDNYWNSEARPFVLGGTFEELWGGYDLTSSIANPPTLFFGASLNATTYAPSTPVTYLNAPFDRAEPYVVAHPTQNAVATWTDLRTEADDDAGNPSTTGHIQLMAATLSPTFQEGTEILFDHARFIENTSELAAVTAGTNVLLIWLDERDGMGVNDPKPEVWMETVWY
jgi:hypothetical protein